MKKRRTRKKGGNPETKFHFYARKMKRNERIDQTEFKAFLDSVKDPLFSEWDFENDGNKYTINEYAILHNAPLNIHAVFWDYPVNLSHISNYFSTFGTKTPLTILEAYIIQGIYSENIRVILEQIQADFANSAGSLFRVINNKQPIPTVLHFAMESSNYEIMPLDQTIYNMIIQIYFSNSVYRYLSKNNSVEQIKELVALGIKTGKADFTHTVLMKATGLPNIIHIIFSQMVISFLLLQDNKTLFDTVFYILQRLDQRIVLEHIAKYNSDQIIHQYNVVKDAKQFFSLVAQKLLQNTIEPYTGKRVRIIIRCHGIVENLEKQHFEFPFNSLCFFVELGKSLNEIKCVSNRTEKMICNGNFDNNLTCITPENNRIYTEPMKFVFDSGFITGKRNRYTGIYVCKDGNVNRADELDINEDIPYDINGLRELCLSVCQSRNINPSDIDIMLFACRTQLGFIEEKTNVTPNITVNI